jgi:serine protease
MRDGWIIPPALARALCDSACRLRRPGTSSFTEVHARPRPPPLPPHARRSLALVALALALLIPAGASAAGPDTYAPNEVLVKYATEHTRLLRLAPGVSVTSALSRLRGRRDVLWAVPDYRAHASGEFIPNDPGTGGVAGDWKLLQWNFLGTFGVNAPEAWANVAADGAPGGRGVVVAVLDTGVAYANRGRFRRSPDFNPYGFVRGYDFVAKNPFPNDHNGHGTFVAGTIAEATNNHYGLTGLAYGARLMPVRVLNNQGEGEASTIAYPARAPDVIAVGATTEHGCLASYSNDGSGLTLVAPGGGADADLPGDPNCHPELPSGHYIYQMTFTGSSPRRFGFPSGYEGTSMASPHVAATAALIIASGVLGRHPSPAQVTARLRATARPLGGPGDSRLYGAGLVNAGAATAPGGPGAVAR